MPPHKKRRMAAAAAAADAESHESIKGDTAMDDVAPATTTGDDASNSAATTKLLEQHRAALKTLQANIAELAEGGGGGAPSAELVLSSSLALSNLKSLQRRIALQVEAHADASRERRQLVEERSLVLENLNYERNYLRGEIGSMRGWRAGELEKMAWKELGIDPAKLKEEGEEEGEKDDAGDVAMEDAEKTGITSAEEAIDAYLLGDDSDGTSKSHRDPSNHARITEKLQSDLEARTSLVEQLSKSKLQLREMQKKRDELRGFLTQMPKKFADLEKAGESLNKFFASGNVWKDALNADDDDADDGATDEKKVQAANLLVNRPSSDRTKRFQLAKSNLPSPLYVLFVQLVGYLDAWASLDKLGESAAASGEKKTYALDGFVGGNGMDVMAMPPEKDEESWTVVLTISPSDILPSEVTSILSKSLSRSSSGINIVFSFNEEEGVVYASVKGDENDGLLDGLFPGDDGSSNPNQSLSILKQSEEDEEENNEEESESTNDDANKGEGKPYFWCQVLSGLDFPPPLSLADKPENLESDGDKESPFQIQTCTKAVFRQLLRRIRADKTLSAIHDCLGKRSQMSPPLPIHPAMKVDGDANQPRINAKLHSWAENSTSPLAHVKCYVATIKRKSSTLKATVAIDTHNYPAEPPVWSLQNEDGSTGTLSSWGEEHGNVSSLQQNAGNGNAPPLFDAALHRIECHVNQELDKFVRQEVETTYDWILIHQLADIVSCWDEVMSASESSGKAKSGDDAMGIVGSHGRMRKGKDRRLIGFGERSPFFWYRNGL